MQIHCLPLGSYQTNCYIVHSADSKSCAVIDPGCDARTILEKTAALGLSVDAILLTHGHFDHVGAVEALVKATDCKLWMSQRDYTQFQTPENDMIYPIHDCGFTEVWFCEDAEQISAGGLTFTVMDTPGHTWGSVCYLCDDALFSGDTLFCRSIGRTDLPGGDWNTMRATLERLAEIDEDYVVYPGHGPKTTLSHERKYNPYLR